MEASPWRVWSKRQWVRFAVSGIVAFIIVPAVAKLLGFDVVVGIALGTGLVVLAYTVETQGMRLELVRSNTMGG